VPIAVRIVGNGDDLAQAANIVERFQVGHVHNEYPLVDEFSV